MIVNRLSRHAKFVSALLLCVFSIESAFAVVNSIQYGLNAGTREKPFVEFIPINNLFNNKPSISLKSENKDLINDISAVEISEAYKKVEIGPGQPEMSSFSSVNANNMVDLFTGDFAYNIPVMDVGGYPINLSYRGGISMDQEASWVGLGWNVNPGTISRNMRGLPDDFNGDFDSVKKTLTIKENKTVGVNVGSDFELFGSEQTPALPSGGLTVGIGVFKNTYKGWGIEKSVGVSITSGEKNNMSLTGGLSLTNNTQEGYSINPSLAVNIKGKETDGTRGSFSFGVNLPYNSRSGLKSLQLSSGNSRQYYNSKTDQGYSYGNGISANISFAAPSFTPSITTPFTSRQYSFRGKIGWAYKGMHPNIFVGGYVSKQFIAPEDTTTILPAFGYLNFQHTNDRDRVLLDFNREKELIYREKPATPHIALPYYSYDAFSITGEGTGGMFRAYRGDIGFVFDHSMKTKDESTSGSVDIGTVDLVHLGLDVSHIRSISKSGPWTSNNPLKSVNTFKDNNGLFEAAYFRNPGEKAINSKEFYNAVGGDDVVTVRLAQSNTSRSNVMTTNYLDRYKSKTLNGNSLLTVQNAIKNERDKRTQVISYLNAKEASVAGFSKYIENYSLNDFDFNNCTSFPAESGTASGLVASYFPNKDLEGIPQLTQIETTVDHDWAKNSPISNFPWDRFSVRWAGRIKAPVTGQYVFETTTDDGVRLWINDSLIINKWYDQSSTTHTGILNLVQDEIYTIKLEFYENKSKARIHLKWSYPGQGLAIIPQQYLYPPSTQTSFLVNNITLEKRINSFRKPNHISQISVLNNDGRRYIYGIPVYNLKQKEATFSVASEKGNSSTGLVGYDSNDNTTANNKGKEMYYSSEEIPAYAHSFLLTSIITPDYSDVTGDGISPDDIGDAIKFNYSKVSGIENPFKWRVPYVEDSATYNEGMRTYSRDDKGSYVCGEKELWYLHSIESKTLIATFVLENRSDLWAADENGIKSIDSSAKRLKEIRLYSKADLIKNPTDARPIKTVHFAYTYELCMGVNEPRNDSGKLTLKKVWFSYNGNYKGEQNPYEFHYSGNNPGFAQKQYDRWGNYKHPLQNPGSIVNSVITNDEYPYAIQDSLIAAQNVMAWMLDSISLPSGGSLKVEYESDDYAFVQNKRVMQMMKIKGFDDEPGMTQPSDKLYTPPGFPNIVLDDDNLYVYVELPVAVSDEDEFFEKYLYDKDKSILNNKIFFRLNVEMPTDNYGSGYEYVSCYSLLDKDESFGLVNSNLAWLKLEGISLKGDQAGGYSPLAKAAIQFLRLNLPSKAYPGSEVGENVDSKEAITMLASMFTSISSAFKSFDRNARENGWACKVNLEKSFVRLSNPDYKRYGGGHRVKRVVVYDNWDRMTNQRAAKYGQEYIYCTEKEVFGNQISISSGVASYEPMLGSEENPFHEPIEYVERTSSVLGQVNLSYSEEPLGESLFPSPGIGYSKVRVRTINYKDRKSANGFQETGFYTAYDFPVRTDRTMLDDDNKKRFKPALLNLFGIAAKHYVTISQGFKIELNDMHGKLRYQASYPENDPKNYLSYTANYYKVEDPFATHKTLSNTVMVVHPDGTIDPNGIIGKDVEIMMDMREQRNQINSPSLHLNSDLFSIPGVLLPFLIPTLFNLAQSQDLRFRSIATTKVIQRYGILDSVVSIDKGSMVITRDILYDSETGNTVLNRTLNEFKDPIYTFNYPSHWAYDGIGLAYKNIDAIFHHVGIMGGRIVTGMSQPDSNYFVHGDEVLAWGKQKTGSVAPCDDVYSSFGNGKKLWVIDGNMNNIGPKKLYFIDEIGNPYSGYDVSLKIIRSGRRNIHTSVGSITTLKNPLVYNVSTQDYSIELNTATEVIAASAVEFNDKWHKNANCVICTGTLSGQNCIHETVAEPVSSVTLCSIEGKTPYSSCGTYIYSEYEEQYFHFIRSQINSSNSFWINTDDPSQCNYSPIERSEEQWEDPIMSREEDTCEKEFTPSVEGPLNRCGVWLCPTGESEPYNQWVTVIIPIEIPEDGEYYIGMAADNHMKVYIDGQLFKQDDDNLYNSGGPDFYNPENFKIWHVYPKVLKAGTRAFKFEVLNGECYAAFGLEIYHNSEEEISNATSYEELNLIFSTKDLDQQEFVSEYACPDEEYDIIFDEDVAMCRKIEEATSYDNPVTTGISGNWRGLMSYVYYGTRTTSDPNVKTNIRKDGIYTSFSPFWEFQNNKLSPQYDPSKWVWNSRITEFNRKGLEVENKDPLGRYNSGLYGYALTLPVAVIQNSKSRESAFEGFEDYDFSAGTQCNNACSDLRHWDFTSYISKISADYKHSGKYSLKLTNWNTVTISGSLKDSIYDRILPQMNISTTNTSCYSEQMTGITYTNDNEFTQFAPSKGKMMVLSAWGKEEQNCNCTSYQENEILVSFQGTSTNFVFTPSGPIIEGWQRYEGVFQIPLNATGISISLKSKNATAYFDDIRLHPFNSNMKSFVYHPTNLRLMAELDENNYATFYEYDDDGTLIRVKKETYRGIKTIKEIRSALVKQ